MLYYHFVKSSFIDLDFLNCIIMTIVGEGGGGEKKEKGSGLSTAEGLHPVFTSLILLLIFNNSSI